MLSKLLIAGSFLIASTLTQASCFNVYKDNLVQVEDFIQKSNHKQVLIEAGALATTTNAIVIAGLAGTGGPLVSTAAGAGMIASLYLASTYIDLRTDDNVEEAFAKKSLLESSLNLLKQAKLGNGPLLQDAIVGINRSVSTSISLKDLAEKIDQQSNERIYCQNSEEVMSPAGILKTAIEELKTEL